MHSRLVHLRLKSSLLSVLQVPPPMVALSTMPQASAVKTSKGLSLVRHSELGNCVCSDPLYLLSALFVSCSVYYLLYLLSTLLRLLPSAKACRWCAPGLRLPTLLHFLYCCSFPRESGHARLTGQQMHALARQGHASVKQRLKTCRRAKLFMREAARLARLS